MTNTVSTSWVLYILRFQRPNSTLWQGLALDLLTVVSTLQFVPPLAYHWPQGNTHGAWDALTTDATFPVAFQPIINAYGTAVTKLLP